MRKCLIALCLAQSVVLFAARAAAADAVTAWNAIAARGALAACIAPLQDPLHEVRLYAMMHVAVHDALNAIDLRSRPYTFRPRLEPGASPDAAVAAAARGVLVPLLGQIGFPFPPACSQAGIALVESEYHTALAAVPDGAAKIAGIELGEASAAAILALRKDDGSDTSLLDFAYPQGLAPGEYRFTPGFPFAFAPGWGDVTLFAPDHAGQFHVRRPFRVSGRKYVADFNEVKALGGDGVTTPSMRTADQTEVALFWVESPPLQWNRIARAASESTGLDLWENARLFGVLNVALADGYIEAFADKYRYNFWRPVTAIREAADDGNPDTVADPAWSPLVQTPAIPEHDSGHSVEGGAAAAVLKAFFHNDHIAFSTCSLTLPPGLTCADPSPLLRSYRSFSEAADENGVSRILVGFHFRNAVEQGIEHGRAIGDRVIAHVMRSVGSR